MLRLHHLILLLIGFWRHIYTIYIDTGLHVIVDTDAAALHRWWHLHCGHSTVAIHAAVIHVWAGTKMIRYLMLQGKKSGLY